MCSCSGRQSHTKILGHYIYRIGYVRHKTICHTVVVYSELDIVLAEIECRIGVAVADCGVFHRHCRLDYAVDNLIFEFLYFGSYAKIVIFESHGYCGVDRVPRRRKHREAKRIGGDDINGYTSAGRRHFIGFWGGSHRQTAHGQHHRADTQSAH